MTEAREKWLTRWDPFRELLESWDPFREGAIGPRRFGRALEELLGEGARGLRPPVDVTETDDCYVVTTEIPGVKKADVNVELEEGRLTIRGEKRSERDEHSESGRLLERTFGAFSRTMALPTDADPDKVRASYSDGVLRVEIQKRPEAKPKQVAIKG